MPVFLNVHCPPCLAERKKRRERLALSIIFQASNTSVGVFRIKCRACGRFYILSLEGGAVTHCNEEGKSE